MASAWLQSVATWIEVGDPLAEAAVAAIRQAKLPRSSPSASVLQLAAQGDTACAKLIAEMAAVPAWVDFDLMRQGGAMTQRHFPMLVLALTYGCLPLTFAHPSSAAVFVRTGRLQADIIRRLNESATLFFGVAASDTLRPHQKMWEACLHVRLVHAIVRMQLLTDTTWNRATYGLPISQLQTAAGPAYFGSHLLACLRELGVRFTESEAIGHKMIWRYVTKLLGVTDALVFADQKQQDAFDAHVVQEFLAPDEASRQMVADMLAGLCSRQPTANLPAAFQAALMRRLLGARLADGFGLSQSVAGDLTVDCARFAFGGYTLVQRLPVLNEFLRRTGADVFARFASEGIVGLEAAGAVT
ncbi:MAG: DUF2236 domain-containing protein [Spirochaetes bacterium]|nr:DUF2236 domain-containing protein [Spirochaetota bacterium]